MAAADAILAKARAGDAEAFRTLTDPYRAELQAHCYRMLGSLQDAEDVVQETLLAAWRALRGFEGRSSPRAWLYRIATNRCLNALRDERGAAGRVPERFPPPTRFVEPLHLEPFPDALLDRIPDAAPGPAARYEVREALGLAFVSGLQRLPAQQRAVLVLRDVLGFSARDVAGILDTTEPAVTSALQRARAALDHRPAGAREAAPLPSSAVARRLAGRFADAFLAGDVDGVVALLHRDARLTMPPQPLAYEGRDAIRGFLAHHAWWGSDRVRLVPTGANGQPALALYLADAARAAPALNGLLVLTVEGDAVSAITRFGREGIHPAFGLPAALDL
jgi:RNA polymerase sigma-70 factor (ECF subfamily)